MHCDDSRAHSRPDPAQGGTAARLVQLCAEQIRAAVDEASSEIESLSLAVLDTARHADRLAGRVRPSGAGLAGEKGAGDESQPLREAALNASSKLQFADRMSQRLANTASNLAALAQLMQTTERPISDEDWSTFLDAARARFTMEHERRMFDAVFETAGPAPPASDLDDRR